MIDMKTPGQEWAEFSEKAVIFRQLSPSEIYTLKLVFVGALLSATGFFDDLMASGYSREERVRRYELWKDGLQEELDSVEFMVTELAEAENGRTN